MVGKDAELFSKDFNAELLNIPGQEYTIGSAWPGRRDKDEFIFCSFPLVEPLHCRVSVDVKGDYWIHQISRKSKTFLNRRLLTKEKVQLKFGDTIAFGDEQSSSFEFEERDLQNYNDETYRKIGREYEGLHHKEGGDGHYHWHNHKEDVSRNGRELGSTVGSSPAILHQILNKFRPSDLLPLRLISSIWNDVITQIMRGSAEILLSFHADDYNGSTGTQFFRCAQETRGFEVESLNLVLENLDPPGRPKTPLEGTQAQKFLSDLSQYLDTKKEMKRLTIEGRIRSEDEFKIFETALTKTSSSLSELTLKTKITLPLQPFKTEWNFVKLKRLTTLDYSKCSEIQLKWAKFVLSKISLHSLQEYYSKEEKQESYFLKEIVFRNFPNLTKLSVQNVTPDVLQLLLKLKSPVTNLRLIRVRSISEEENILILEKVLEKFAPFLQALTLGVEKTRRPLEFPISFPKLETFKFMYTSSSKIKPFSGSFINYGKTFPKLRRLSVKMDTGWDRERRDKPWAPGNAFYSEISWMENRKVFKTFFPGKVGSGEICTTLTELDVPHLSAYFEPMMNKYVKTVKSLSSLFPNVDHRWVKVANAFSLKEGHFGNVFTFRYEIDPNHGFRFYSRPKPSPRKWMATAAPRRNKWDSDEASVVEEDSENSGDSEADSDSDSEINNELPKTVANPVTNGRKFPSDMTNPQAGPSRQQLCSTSSSNRTVAIPARNPKRVENGSRSEEWENLWKLLGPKVRKISESNPKAGAELQLKIHELVAQFEIEHLFE